jgi:putative oxidoreductase
MLKQLLNSKPISVDVGLLIFRVVVGVLMLPHGWPKLANFAERMEKFSDPLGIGSTLSLTGTVIAEFFCSLLLILGLFTRAALIPLIFTFIIITFVVHGDDPLGDRETQLLFLTCYLVLLFTGPGKYSIDARLK